MDAPTSVQEPACVVQLLSHVQDNDRLTCTLNPEAIQKLRSAKGDITPICVIGPSRTGKSYFLSTLVSHLEKKYGIQGAHELFKSSHSTNACTAGVWMCIMQVEGKTYLLMDCEGTGRGSDKITGIISCFGAACGSTVVTLFAQSLDNTFFLRMATMTQFLSTLPDFERVIGLPKLDIIITQALDFMDEAEQEIPPEEYLFRELSEVRPDDGYNECRGRIKRFKNVGIELFRQLGRDKLPLKQRECTYEIYLLDHARIAEKILREAQVKTISGTPADGPALALFMEQFVDSINNNTPPSLPNLLSAMQSDIYLRELIKVWEVAVLPRLGEFQIDGNDNSAWMIGNSIKMEFRNSAAEIQKRMNIPDEICRTHVLLAEGKVDVKVGEVVAHNEVLRERQEGERQRAELRARWEADEASARAKEEAQRTEEARVRAEEARVRAEEAEAKLEEEKRRREAEAIVSHTEETRELPEGPRYSREDSRKTRWHRLGLRDSVFVKHYQKYVHESRWKTVKGDGSVVFSEWTRLREEERVVDQTMHHE